jgi:tetratricopeptide (TPR) repeat protein
VQSAQEFVEVRLMTSRCESLLEEGLRRRQAGELAGADAALTAAARLADQQDGALRVRLNQALGGLRRAQGRYAEAEALLREALARAEMTLGQDTYEVAVVLNELALTFKFSGKFAEAEQLYRCTLAILEDATAEGSQRFYQLQ